MTEIEKIDQEIAVYQGYIRNLEIKRAALIEEQKELIANENAYNACFDGLKFIADPENPFVLKFPMRVKANMYYEYTEGTTCTEYVCTKDGIATEDLIEEFFVVWSTKEVEAPTPDVDDEPVNEPSSEEGNDSTSDTPEEGPIELALPMNVIEGKHYVLNDGIKNIYYVCIQSGECTSENILDYLEPEMV